MSMLGRRQSACAELLVHQHGLRPASERDTSRSWFFLLMENGLAAFGFRENFVCFIKTARQKHVAAHGFLPLPSPCNTAIVGDEGTQALHGVLCTACGSRGLDSAGAQHPISDGQHARGNSQLRGMACTSPTFSICATNPMVERHRGPGLEGKGVGRLSSPFAPSLMHVLLHLRLTAMLTGHAV
jgi:hypothetical protein